MESVRSLLNRVWAEFGKVGIADDLDIIEALAAFLLEIDELYDPDDRSLPRKPTQSNLDTEFIRQLLTEAANLAGGTATLFDRHLLFRLSTMLPGGRYPTPRHIVDIMLRLVGIQENQVQEDYSIADFTCGSGGFLICNHTGRTLGIDISPEWVRLAQANLKLHHIPDKIKVGNALQVFRATDLTDATFDRILMNPPFGIKLDPKLEGAVLNQITGSRSETVLTVLALQKLTQEGEAAILVPSGVLSGSSSGERTLRKQLVADQQFSLQAVISLPRDAFQPYSPLQTHLLLIHKHPPSPTSQTWFLRVEQDGYPAGRSRDLTEPPPRPEQSDMPLVEQVLRPSDADTVERLPTDHPKIETRWLTRTNSALSEASSSLVGIVLQGINTDFSVWFHPANSQENQSSDCLTIETVNPIADERVRISIPLPLQQPLLQVESSASDESEEPDLDSLADEEVQKDVQPRLLVHSVRAAAIALLNSLQVGGNRVKLFGVAVQTSTIQEPTYDLRPEQYIKTQEESRSTDSPAVLLTKIYRNQIELAQRINTLFGRLELPPITGQPLPPPLAGIDPFAIPQDSYQMTVWKKIQEKIDEFSSEEHGTYEIATHFTPAEVTEDNSGQVSKETQATLDLFERMGIIVPVAIAVPNAKEPLPYYRRVTQQDRWDLSELDESSMEEESE